jgi:hypothetical protein
MCWTAVRSLIIPSRVAMLMPELSLGDDLETTREELQALGVAEDLFRDILAVRLLVERLGEVENNDWWDSRVFTALGRDSLAEVTPKTQVKARFDLAMKVGRKVEREATPDDSLSLFYLGPTGEAQLEALLEDIDGESEFGHLEDLEASFTDQGWTASLVDYSNDIEPSGQGPIEIGTIDAEAMQDHDTLNDVALQCFQAYGNSTQGTLRVPYFQIQA